MTTPAVRDFAGVILDNDAVLGLAVSRREPTAEMRLVAEQQGFAKWHTEKRYPRMQHRIVKQLLEHPLQDFEIPESYRVQRSAGVGRLVDAKQESLTIDD